MKNKLLKIVPKKVLDDECVEIARQLYEDCKTGKVVAFVTVTLDEKDSTSLFIGNNKQQKNMLQLLGAVWMLDYFCHDVMDEEG